MNPTVGIFFGGRTVEHEVSVISAMQAIAAIDPAKYNVVPVYIAKSGDWYTGSLLTNIDNFKDLNGLIKQCDRCALVRGETGALLVRVPPSRFGRNVLGAIDIAFPIMHGTGGEDGTLQGYFEMIGIPYVGCHVLGSAVGMDKVFAKSVLKDEGLPVLDHVWFYTAEIQAETERVIAEIEKKFPYPLIVKPANLGSSVGISSADNRSELEEALELAATFSLKIMIEPKVVNIKEVNCSVLGDYSRCEASVCEEPVRTDAILSYKDKYMSGGKASKGMSSLQRKIPAEISPEMNDKIRSLAKKAFLAMDCAGVVRIDFIVDTGTNAVYINELNTIPGSLSFYLWDPVGVNYTDLTTRLIELALKRHRERASLTFSFDTNILAMRSKAGSKVK